MRKGTPPRSLVPATLLFTGFLLSACHPRSTTPDQTDPTSPECRPEDARAEGDCDMVLEGFYWDGRDCQDLYSGCRCVGADCANLPTTRAACEQAHATCR